MQHHFYIIEKKTSTQVDSADFLHPTSLGLSKVSEYKKGIRKKFLDNFWHVSNYLELPT